MHQEKCSQDKGGWRFRRFPGFEKQKTHTGGRLVLLNTFAAQRNPFEHFFLPNPKKAAEPEPEGKFIATHLTPSGLIVQTLPSLSRKL